ncbi:MAG: membrane protein [Herpetosiphonaceae bacterium]|nr:MAG: membrane protein [Herpetosiphonaceae bacterium]
MDLLREFVDLFLHLDKHLDGIIRQYGLWTYLILFLIIFAETGLVITPFLPGDSLLFAVGAFAARGSFDVMLVFILLSIAAIVGDTVNYWIGYTIGPKIFHKENVRFLNKKHLDRTHEFYEKHGGKTIIIARFIPIIRTFAPFVAGIGRMTYGRFISYNVIGGLLWISIFVFGGYFFGNIQFVKERFSLVIVAIIVISVMPMIIELIRARRERPVTSQQ